MSDHFKPPDIEEAKRAYARTLRSALCLSGGGIRSATFNLGVLQGLARHGLLDKFDYLSTVSGGGFIGGWLTAWLHREGKEAVIEKLRQSPRSPVEPEPDPITHLRIFSNYLSPRPGLLSADTWTLVSTLLRNLVLTWLVFVPVLALALLAPRAWMAVVNPAAKATDLALTASFAVGMSGAWIALTFAGLALSRRKKDDVDPYKTRESPFLFGCLLPGVVSAAAFAVYWARLTERLGAQVGEHCSWLCFVVFALVIIIPPMLITLLLRFIADLRGVALNTPQAGWQQGYNVPMFLRRAWGAMLVAYKILFRIGLAAVLIIVAQGVAGTVLYAVLLNFFPHPEQHQHLYATFSVPLIISVLLLGCALIVGLTSTLTKDEEMEWWARAGAWFMIAIVGWLALHLLILLGPTLIVDFVALLAKLWDGTLSVTELSKSIAPILTVAGGVVSGIITLAGGFSGQTPAHGEEAKAPGLGSRLLGPLTNLLAPVFFAFVVLLIALGTNWLLTGLSGWLLPTGLARVAGGQLEFAPSDHLNFVLGTSLPLIIACGALLALVGATAGTLINTNKFSLHFMWRDRIIRAYLGASRDPEKRNPQPFTNFDTDDNIYMCELRAQPRGIRRPEILVTREALGEENKTDPRDKLFPVLNIALNLAGGDKLAWQDRKAESFTVSPLHAGSYWLGYRRTRAYGGDDGGISLGTAIAISGAFVSPNMGYMMSSPVVRFLMTLFNVRFGWWLGNPGEAGDNAKPHERLIGFIRHGIGFGKKLGKPFEAASPLLSVLPIVSEAFGQTNDKSSYVYLSDGGHFENLGLYEMVLRRCRFIVVCDASTDADYSFDSLAQSIRQIRVDLGVPIEMRDMFIEPPSQGLRGKYCSVGTIRYSCVDNKTKKKKNDGGGPQQEAAPEQNPDDAKMEDAKSEDELEDADFDGTLIYIKASMIGEEPRDVINYGRGSKTFPQEVIVDQWFSEAQFESYRALGSHIIDAICSGNGGQINHQNRISLAAFERKAREHNQLNFRAFRERADYDMLSAELRRSLRRAPGSYRARVKSFMDDLLGS